MTPLFATLGALKDHWYVLASERQVPRSKPKRLMIWHVPVVLWRDQDGQVVAMLDRCPHRDVPLSRGRVRQGRIKCPYHGWEFAAGGACVLAPVLGGAAPKQRRAYTLPVRVADGLVWIWLGGEQAPTYTPPSLDSYRAQGMKLTYRRRHFHAAAIDLVENFVDAPHTPVLHRGLIRGHQAAVRRQVVVRSDATSVTVVHEESADQVGIAQRLINPTNASTVHSDRFQLPALVQVDYRFGLGSFLAFIFCTPVTPTETTAHIILGVKFGWATPLVRLVLPLLARIVLRQDAAVMAWQAANLAVLPERADGFLDSDLMHVKARQLWRNAMAGKPPLAASERQVEMFV